MNKIIVLSFLLPFVSTYTLTPLSIDMEQELITIFDCNFYNNIIDMNFIVNDIHTNINVNQKNYAIYVTITSNNSMNKKYNFGIINICSDSYKKIICNMEQCMSDNYEELKKTIDNIIKVKISKTHLENYFNYLFLQATDFINKNK